MNLKPSYIMKFYFEKQTPTELSTLAVELLEKSLLILDFKSRTALPFHIVLPQLSLTS